MDERWNTVSIFYPRLISQVSWGARIHRVRQIQKQLPSLLTAGPSHHCTFVQIQPASQVLSNFNLRSFWILNNQPTLFILFHLNRELQDWNIMLEKEWFISTERLWYVYFLKLIISGFPGISLELKAMFLKHTFQSSWRLWTWLKWDSCFLSFSPLAQETSLQVRLIASTPEEVLNFHGVKPSFFSNFEDETSQANRCLRLANYSKCIFGSHLINKADNENLTTKCTSCLGI